MKKTLAALAVLGAFSGAALAQSSVEIYGIADGGLEVVDSGVSGVKTFTGVSSGQQSGSRFGFKGAEKLGNGLTAKFVLENGFNVDDGKLGQGNRLFGRQAWLGLEGGYGIVALGRLASIASGTGSFDMMGAMDPFSTGFKDAGTQATFALTSYRTDNSVVYQSPKFAGFQFGAMYSFQADGSEVADADLNSRFWAAAANYGVGKLWAGLSYEQLDTAKAKNAAGQVTFDPKATQVVKFGINYDFGFVKPMFAYSYGKDVRELNSSANKITFASATGIYGADMSSYMIGATAPLFGGTLMASYQLLDAEMSHNSSVKFARDVFSAGYDYPFS